MRVFDDDDAFPGKYNFVDDYNVYVGYDSWGICCENFGWFIADEVCAGPDGDNNQERADDMEGYNFVPDYMKEAEYEDEGYMVIFKLVKSEHPPKYLHLYNCHNGYYSHGFVMRIDDIIKREGSL